jgi:hypothetical protein
MTEDKGLLRSPQGDVSSKRVAGLVLIVIGVTAGFVGAGIGNALLVDYAKWIVGFGSGLLGLGMFEHLR